MTTRSNCTLRFNTSLDNKRTVRIPDPASTLDVPTIESAADRFIVANPFDATIGTLTSLASAELTTANTISLI